MKPSLSDMRKESSFSNLFKISKPSSDPNSMTELKEKDQSLNVQVNKLLQLDGSSTIKTMKLAIPGSKQLNYKTQI